MTSWIPCVSSLKSLPWIAGLAIGNLFYGYPASAQSIIRDSSTTLVNGGESCSGICTITGGSVLDSSLFHSFQKFNVDPGGAVIFNDPGVENIIGQVTMIDSSNVSTIDGTLVVTGGANLFLLNPNGFIFGEEAALNVAGAFVASTAEDIIFDSDITLSEDPNIVPLLTLSTPVGLQLGSNSRDIIVNTPTRSDGSGLARLGGIHGQTLAFVGRHVELAPAAEIQVVDFLGSSGGTIHLQALETISLTDATIENALVGDGDGSNRVILEAPTINLSGGTQVVLVGAGSGKLGQIDVTANTLSFNATDALRDSHILAFSIPGSTVNSGNVNVQTDILSLINGARIESRTLGDGSAGDVRVQNTGTIEVIGFNDDAPSGIASVATIPTAGAGGQVTIDTASLVVSGGGQIATSTRSSQEAGNLTVNASESVILEGNTPDGRSGLFANALASAGAGGNVTVNTPNLNLRDGATINVSNSPSSPTSAVPSGTGPAGNIFVQNADIIILDGQSILTADTVDGTGANITLEADAVVLKDGSQITTSATGNAQGGNIDINANVLLATGNSDITANAVNSFGGQISIDAQAIVGAEFRTVLTPESDITAFSEQGSAFSGQVLLNTPEIDPTQGVIELSQTLVSNEQVQASCGPVENNTFVVSARGGLPQDAREVLRNYDTLWQDARLINDASEHLAEAANIISGDTSTDKSLNDESRLLEAQAWSINELGQVQLTSTQINTSTWKYVRAC